jgi:pyridinium-3,5-bisthiocarboxylic acid mononucleotide nickel chelatase
MKILYLDPIAGISGDMFLGLLLDLGVEAAAVEAELRRLPLSGWQWQCRRESRQGIAATRLQVSAPEEHQHRTWAQIDRMLADSSLQPAVQDCARRIFRRIGVAEAAVHGMPLEKVHFHEVGALDSIIDIVGAAVALQLLGIDTVRCAPLPLSRGFVQTAHGTFPLPAPATVEILRGCPVCDGNCDQELVTPTGAAIAAEIATFGPWPAMTVERVGYGAGERQLADRPNLLRGVIGTPAAAEKGHDRVAVLESHLDDANPEWLGALLERLLTAGALDVSYGPIQMKKNRPGIRVTVVTPPAAAPLLAKLLLRESSASGVRCHETLRFKLERRLEIIDTPVGPAQVKLLSDDSGLLRVTPEFESCQQLAQKSGRPLPEIYRLVERAADVLFNNDAEAEQ